ncbi:redox-sensing transcriptional repressor Rex [Sphaerobacter thermophilus]|jgi:redox-sensing transcriptional repressor|uniref:Redox-sensing transcriptional repressor Rex n=1 Tax=Sphaerobacter thermophilus (strain ATCC 49802 / DSM 20745 / KCCM 41009 / NCIMB 13125 / S 6022) TaxID=479434 RepID=D1C616_SPHTD|nr:redox-sensing transcriptional repressor Rex [Sphaerobacter thermophilus]ACZ39568.1 CoA-binding domain protein [Sphaerobacter thermophilus DSM 20745]
MRRGGIPDIVIRRLPIYERTLKQMLSAGVTSISSEELGERIGVTAAQIRRDLSYFGKFGKQGKGYDVARLAEEIAHILKLDRQWDVALAGFGHLGQAIAHYRGFEPNAFRIAAIFARNPEHIGQQVNGTVVLDEAELTPVIREMGIKIGIVAVPAAAAQDVADRMIAGGVRAILNYAPVILKVPESVWVREIDPVSALQSLTYYLDNGDPSHDGRAAPVGESLATEAAGH